MRIVYLIGNRFKIVRSLYYKLSGHRWLWGIRGFLDDYMITDPHQCTIDDLIPLSERTNKRDNNEQADTGGLG